MEFNEDKHVEIEELKDSVRITAVAWFFIGVLSTATFIFVSQYIFQ